MLSTFSASSLYVADRCVPCCTVDIFRECFPADQIGGPGPYHLIFLHSFDITNINFKVEGAWSTMLGNSILNLILCSLLDFAKIFRARVSFHAKLV